MLAVPRVYHDTATSSTEENVSVGHIRIGDFLRVEERREDHRYVTTFR